MQHRTHVNSSLHLFVIKQYIYKNKIKRINMSLNNN